MCPTQWRGIRYEIPSLAIVLALALVVALLAAHAGGCASTPNGVTVESSAAVTVRTRLGDVVVKVPPKDVEGTAWAVGYSGSTRVAVDSGTVDVRSVGEWVDGRWQGCTTATVRINGLEVNGDDGGEACPPSPVQARVDLLEVLQALTPILTGLLVLL